MSWTSSRHSGEVFFEGIDRFFNATRILFADWKMDQSDYRELIAECQSKLNVLEIKLSVLAVTEKNIDNILITAIQNMISLDKSYLAGSTKNKREIIGSIFPKNCVLTNTILEQATLTKLFG